MNFYDWLETRKGMPFRFQMYEDDGMREREVFDLGLSTRAVNVLERNKIRTVGDLLDRKPTVFNLMNLRGCGKNTAREIMLGLFMLQVDNFTDEDKRNEYLQLTYELNTVA